jgi:hypothetical protein
MSATIENKVHPSYIGGVKARQVQRGDASHVSEHAIHVGYINSIKIRNIE